MRTKTKLPENKVNILIKLDCNLLHRIKELSARERRTISDIFQDALNKYMDANSLKSYLCKAAVNRFCSKPFNLNTREINEILNEESL